MCPQSSSVLYFSRVIAHIVNELCSKRKDELLRSYVKYVFNATDLCTHKVKSVHEELVKQLTSLLMPNNSDFLVIRKFLKYSWFFFELINKSVSQYLITTNRVKVSASVSDTILSLTYAC